MKPATYTVDLDGQTLRRGFWLYVWSVTTPSCGQVLYVGRTGDNSTPNAQSPFNRMGQHLGTAKNSSMVRNHLAIRGLNPEECTFRLVAHGPVLEEVPGKDMEAHKQRRNVVGALEKRLADDLRAARYDVLNEIDCRWPLDESLYSQVRSAFVDEFPQLDPGHRHSSGG
jgi:hypothetical protein